jgi:hypothetical protein
MASAFRALSVVLEKLPAFDFAVAREDFIEVPAFQGVDVGSDLAHLIFGNAHPTQGTQRNTGFPE